MKKWLIGTLVGGIILFAWQFLSWTVLQFHEAEARYTPAQDSILQYLSSQFKENGTYMLPTTAPGASAEEMEALGSKMHGKPWATLTYRTSYDHGMTRPMIRGFLVDLFLVFCLIYILTRGGIPPAMRVFAGSVAVGLLSFLYGPYTQHNWFQTPTADLHGHLIDALVAWGLVGLWLGWWLNRGKSR
ncbi:MAG: hypothetical protein IAE96_12455 [Chitinophagaceae bacterium]|nr:hypothetical protein [Chitinophagaceae bacterium]